MHLHYSTTNKQRKRKIPRFHIIMAREVEEDEQIGSMIIDAVDNDSNSKCSNEDNLSPPAPKFAIKQKLFARDTDTPLLYEAVVRKFIFAPKSKKVHIGRIKLNPDDTFDNQQLDAIYATEPAKTWHYFVHYQGWNVKWDRWIQEDSLFEEKESTRILASRLKEESKCLKKRKQSDNVVLEVMQKMVKLEEEFRDREAKGQPLIENKEMQERKSSANDEPKHDVKESKESDWDRNTKSKAATMNFIRKEINLRQRNLSSKKFSNAINTPFTMKKVLTDEWEVISQCGMLHNIPAAVSVMDVLNAYHDSKIKMLRTDATVNDSIEEKKGDLNKHALLESNDEDIKRSVHDAAEEEWKEMIHGLAIYFDHSLPKKLLYRHELPQCLVLEKDNEDKRYCELYPCEHLLRLCLKLPELVEDANDITDEEKSKIIFKLGDLVRFLQKHQGKYLLQRYRKPTADEREKSKRLQGRLGLQDSKCVESKLVKPEDVEGTKVKLEEKKSKTTTLNKGYQKKKRRMT
jgi:mortality factor 4-like protein 1